MTVGSIHDIMSIDKGEAVSDAKRKRGEANADNAAYWSLYGYNRGKTQKPPPPKVAASKEE